MARCIGEYSGMSIWIVKERFPTLHSKVRAATYNISSLDGLNHILVALRMISTSSSRGTSKELGKLLPAVRLEWNPWPRTWGQYHINTYTTSIFWMLVLIVISIDFSWWHDSELDGIIAIIAQFPLHDTADNENFNNNYVKIYWFQTTNLEMACLETRSFGPLFGILAFGPSKENPLRRPCSSSKEACWIPADTWN